MVTSEQILEATGLRTTKTLTRWQRAGLIPAPQVGTHPSGRGKIAYYPDWVLDRCRRIVELQKQGHGLRSAALALQVERAAKESERADLLHALPELLKEKKVDVGDGLRVDLMTLLHVEILRELRPVLDREDLRHALRRAMGSENVGGRAVQYVLSGYNPVMVSDGVEVEVTTDFVVAHRLSEQALAPRALIVMPLFGIIRGFFEKLSIDVADRPSVRPALAVLARVGDVVLEYPWYSTGTGIEFEILKDQGKVVGKIEPE